MSQNNMISFITLTDLDSEKVELNPAFILMMRRDTYEPEEGIEVPYTKIYLSTGTAIYALETPEEISNLQMQTVAKAMSALMPMMQDIMEDIDY